MHALAGGFDLSLGAVKQACHLILIVNSLTENWQTDNLVYTTSLSNEGSSCVSILTAQSSLLLCWQKSNFWACSWTPKILCHPVLILGSNVIWSFAQPTLPHSHTCSHQCLSLRWEATDRQRLGLYEHFHHYRGSRLFINIKYLFFQSKKLLIFILWSDKKNPS